MTALPRSPESMERRRRRGMSFLQLHIPEASAWAAAIGTPTSEGSFSARYNHAHYPSMPSFTFTAPIGEEAPSSGTPSTGGISETFLLGPGRKFHFGGLRRISQTNLQRSESMVSLCYRNLLTFIEENNLQGLKVFLESKRVSVDDRNENGSTALIVAASKGKLEFAQELVNHGADVNAEDGDNWTALQSAAKEGHTDLVLFLLDHGADINHRDLGGWTPLMWASYKARTATALLLMERGADVNAHGNYHISSLLWASGRGYTDIAIMLIEHGAKVNIGDKYGTTALVWACRKGNAEIVEALLKAGANVDAAGMYSWTPLLVATLGNHVDVVTRLLAYKPNVNALDKDGCTALTITCKEGFHEIAGLLINSGAYINIQDRVGDTNLIHAVKGGHRGVVEPLLKKYAEVNTPGKDKKTALYWAVEKGNIQMVKILLSENPDLEASTKDGDTPLLRAVRTRNAEITQLLLDKKAKVSAADKRGDTALHIAMRARSKAIVEILLRNPKHSQLLYRPNRAGETPYNLDMHHQKPILGQIFGARRLNTNEDNENMLGYDLYSSALADILSEPSLSMPITVGLYAKWGSGKSFLLSKLREEMKNFEAQWVEPLFTFTWLLFLIIVHITLLVGLFVGLMTGIWLAGVFTTVILIVIIYGFLYFVRHSNFKFDWNWLYKINIYLSRKLKSLKLILQVMFCHPPGRKASDENSTQHIKFYFTDQTRMSSTTGGENSVVQMVGSLYDSIESDYGSFSTRLYRAFRPRSVKSDTNWRWRRVCCLPYFIIFEACFIMFLMVISILVIYYFHLDEISFDKITLEVILGTLALLIGVSVVANLYTWGYMFKSIIFSQRRHLQKTISHLDTVKSEGFLQALRQEVSLMTDMVKCLDSFSTQQTRLVVIVDGLDSCEQDKVLLVLDAVHMLFSDSNSPFIVILAIDPHVISKAVEVNSLRLFSESDIGGHDYLRNMVHLPFYLQNSGLRKVKQAQQTAAMHRKATGSGCNVSNWNESDEGLMQQGSTRRLSVHEGGDKSLKNSQPRKGSRKLKMSESIASSLGSNLNRLGGAQDLTKMILTDDYFSDVNPRSMRRLMNVVYVMGRLLKAFQVEFNWYHLASWINITEQWPFRTSWLILYYDMNEDSLDDNTSLKTLYDKVRPNIPISKDAEPYLELDRDEHKFDVFLTFHRNNLLVSDIKIFLPFTINLDPYLKKVIKEEQQNVEDGAPTMMIDQPYGPTSPSQMAWGNKNAHLLRRQQRPLVRGSSIQNSLAMNYPQITPQILNWTQQQNPWMMDPSNTMRVVYPVSYSSPSPVTAMPPALLDIRLSTLSVEGVCELFNKVDDLVLIGPKYFDCIKQNNISGRVLLHCDLQELKRVLNMTFGDWELFRMFIVSLREQELSLVTNIEETSPKNVRFSVPKVKPGPPQAERKTSSNKISEERSSTKIATMEKQVTLEEQMISCALQTLNEEAFEDVLDEVEEELESTSAGIRTSSNESDGYKSCVRRPSQSSMNAAETDIVLLQNSPGHPSIWQQIDSISAASSLSTTPVLTRKLSRGNNIRYSNSNLNSNGSRSRPSSLLMLDDSADLTPPASPRMVTFRSHSIEEEEENINRPPTLQVSSLKMKQSPATSLEKLNRLKDKLLRSVASKPIDHCDIETGLADSDDESTPLVSESGTPAQIFNSNCSKTPSSEISPLSPLSVASPNQQPSNDPYLNSDLIDMTDKNKMTKDCIEGCGSDSCGSSISLSQTLEKTNNFYHLVPVGGSMGSLGKHEQPWEPERKSSTSHLPRQNAMDDEYNPETTV